MLKRPLFFAVLVFIAVVAIGAGILHVADAYPAAVQTPYARGEFVGKTVGIVALIAAIGAYLYARGRAGGGKR